MQDSQGQVEQHEMTAAQEYRAAAAEWEALKAAWWRYFGRSLYDIPIVCERRYPRRS